MFYRPTFAEVNLSSIQENYQKMKKHSGKKVAAVIKANAYGHGMVEVARALEKVKADMFMVATLDEAMKLRENEIKTPILVIGWTSPDWANTAAKNNIALTVFQSEWFDDIRLTEPMDIHLKFDTGMNRIGIKEVGEWKAILRHLKAKPYVRVKGMFTHFATADEKDTKYTTRQTNTWKKWKERAQKEFGDILFHISNSAHGISYQKKTEDMIRLGISLYGYPPSDEVKMAFEVKPSLKLTSVVSHVKKVKKGESIGYGTTYQAQEEEWVATIPIGYADGILRRYAEKGEVLIQGERRKIIGRICMDQLMVRVDEKVKLGNEVVLIGTQGQEIITAEEIAQHSNTNSYEVLCNITERVPRIYI